MSKMRLTAAMSTLAALPSIAMADTATGDATHDWSVTALIGTDVGIDLAAGARVETPHRLRLTATVGWMPRAYSWGLAKYYEHVYDGAEAIGEVLEDALAGAFVFRANLGYRPFADRGAFASVGYTFLTASKNSILASVVEAATGRELEGATGLNRRFKTSLDTQLVSAAVGWQWGLGNGFNLSASVGVIVIVDTSTSFEPLYTPNDPTLVQGFTDLAEERLNDAGTGIVAPEGTLFLGYTF